MFQLAWFKWAVIISSIIIITSVIFESKHKNTISTSPDNCIKCHSDIKDIGKSHPISIFGCAKCHGGNKYATTKKEAHKGIVLNPSRLEYVDKYCLNCHADIIERLKNSIMVTNKGIIGVLNEKLGKNEGYLSVSEIEKNDNNSFAINYYRKMCGACHVNQLQSIFPKNKVRGGGCIDCHGVKNKNNPHTILTTRIPSSNCTKCHNRSNRIGLSYFGQFESAGYGTPYKHGRFSNIIKGGGRYYLKLHSDIHWQKAKMDCIDCHLENGIMGDGDSYKRFENQVIIQCEDCHKPQWGKANKLAKTLAFDNGKINIEPNTLIAYTHKNFNPIYNLQKDKNTNKICFYRKMDGKKIPMTLMSDKPYHNSDIHKRLSCQSCHSEWLPSCYGCHVANFENKKQYDWLSHKPTKGSFREFSSFNRFRNPALGIGWKGKITTFGPGCQSFVTVYSKGIKPKKQFHKLVFAPWDPHTTRLNPKNCIDCHMNPEALGLGRGELYIKNNKINFSPIYDSKKSGLPIDFPLDAFVDIYGKQLQDVSMKNERALNKKELKKIISSSVCIMCHESYFDDIYKNFDKSKKLFLERKTPCSK
jgi:hypothetical protein